MIQRAPRTGTSPRAHQGHAMLVGGGRTMLWLWAPKAVQDGDSSIGPTFDLIGRPTSLASRWCHLDIG